MNAPTETIEARSRVWQWTWRVELYDLEQNRVHGTPIGRARFMAEAKKRAKWGDDRRYWTREGRRQMNRVEYEMMRGLAKLGAILAPSRPRRGGG